MEKFKQVTEAEFDDYLANYPRDLETRVVGGTIKCHCDFSGGKELPQGIVAKVLTDGDEVDEYFVSVNKTTLIYSLDDAESYFGQIRTPREVIDELGITCADTAWRDPQDREIRINGVDPDTLPPQLPPYLRVEETTE